MDKFRLIQRNANTDSLPGTGNWRFPLVLWTSACVFRPLVLNETWAAWIVATREKATAVTASVRMNFVDFIFIMLVRPRQRSGGELARIWLGGIVTAAAAFALLLNRTMQWTA